MKSNRTTALLMLLVFLLVVAVVIIFLTGLDRPTRSDNPYENVTFTAEPSIAVETPSPTPTSPPSVIIRCLNKNMGSCPTLVSSTY